MRHAWVVMDNDYPLGVALSEAKAKDALVTEEARIRESLRLSCGNDPQQIERRYLQHHLHFRMVPIYP